MMNSVWERMTQSRQTKPITRMTIRINMAKKMTIRINMAKKMTMMRMVTSMQMHFSIWERTSKNDLAWVAVT